MPPTLINNLPAHRMCSVYRMSEPGTHHDHVVTGSVIHDHASLGLCIAGEGKFWLGSTYTFKQGSVMCVPEGAPHYMVENHGVHMVGLAMCTHCMRAPWAEPLRLIFERIQQGHPPVHDATEACFEQLRAVLDRLEQCIESPEHTHADLLLDGLMCTLTADLWLVLGQAQARPPESSSLVARALHYIHAHSTEAISLVDVASVVGRHPSHVAECVKQESGRTVVEWITHARMSCARQLLLASDDNLEQIGARVGFASPSHFHRTFKRWHAMSPGKWRKAHRL
jgi:AraC-like DNA-binding protein